MAPEVAQGLHYDHQVDLWSLGVLLYCLAFANYPFARAESHQGMAEILNDCANFEFSYESDEKVQILLENLLKFNPQERSFKLDFQSELALTFYESLRINGKVAWSKKKAAVEICVKRNVNLFRQTDDGDFF